MKKMIILCLPFFLIVVVLDLHSQSYLTKIYQWEKLPDIVTISESDTSLITYSKIQKSSNGKIIIGGRGYYTQYERPIYQYDDLDKTWKILYSKDSPNMDYIIDSQENLIVFGKRKDAANYIIFNNLITNKIDTVALINSKKQNFTRLIEYDQNRYLIKSNDSYNTYLLLFNKLDNTLIQLLPRTDSIDSLNKAIDKDLQSSIDISTGVKKGRIIISSIHNLYYSDDLFKSIHLAFYDKNQLNIYRQVMLNYGQFLYSHTESYDSTNNLQYVGLYGLNGNEMERKTYVLHQVQRLGNKGPFNPICMMACSNGNYIVCKLGGTFYQYGYGDTVNIDSLLISDDRGETFYCVPLPKMDSTYSYFTYASPFVTKDGEIFLVVQPKNTEGTFPTSVRAEIYYGRSATGTIQNKLFSYFPFPNPAYSIARVNLQQEGQVAIMAVDLLGRSFPLWSGYASTGTLELDVSTLPTGPYTLLIDYGTKREAVRLMKE